ncbi:MAG TPA: hypothetical protein VG713_03600 [Pirellulales bacterium]|nr:hypothetical protein [Pirellulales bacterium]
MPMTPGERPTHGHHKLAAAVFVGALIVGSALILAAELMKPERYEFHPGASPTTYVVYDRDTGRATSVEFNTKKPLAAIED